MGILDRPTTPPELILGMLGDDSKLIAAALRDLGATWDEARREHTLEGVPVHIVTEAETGDAPTHTSEIEGVRVVGLADLVRFKLRSGLRSVARAKDLADVVELVKAVPLDKSFAGKLPGELRSEFKKLVDSIEADRG